MAEYNPLDWIAPTQQVAAQVLGVDRRVFQDYLNRGCDCRTSAGYSIPHAVQWARENVWCNRTNVPRQASEGDGNRKENAELRKLEADAEAKEIKVQQLLGTLVDRESVRGALTALLNSIRHRLQAVPEEVGGVIPPTYRADVTFSMKSKIRLILTEMAAWADSNNLNEPAEVMSETSLTTPDSSKSVASPSDPSSDPA